MITSALLTLKATLSLSVALVGVMTPATTIDLVTEHLSATSEPTPEPPSGYDAYDANEGPNDLPVAACLLAKGYRGIAGDSHEWIYAPGPVIDKCVSDLDQPMDSNNAIPIRGELSA